MIPIINLQKDIPFSTSPYSCVKHQKSDASLFRTISNKHTIRIDLENCYT